MSIYSSKRKSRRTSRSQLGHLKLSVYEESSALTIHVYEARGLMRKESAPMDTYVKIYLLPDPQKLTKEKSRIHKQKDPVFNEKFSFILNEKDDIDKRLFISMWSHHTAARNDMIGCMTFKVADILAPNKGLNGWYQLLDEVKGRSEFYQVPSSISRYDTPRVNQPPNTRTFAVTLVRSEKGYGFNVNGHDPVYVSQVNRGLPAAEADVRCGDRIVEVESTEVTKASADLVVNIVKKCPQMLHLILQREITPTNHTHYASLSLKRSRKPNKPSQPSLRNPRAQSYLSIASGPHPQTSHTHRTSVQYSNTQFLQPEYHHHDRRMSAPLNVGGALTQPEALPDQMYRPEFHNPIPEDHVSRVAGHVINSRSSLNLTSHKSREQLFASQQRVGGRHLVPVETVPPRSSTDYAVGALSQPYGGEFNVGGSVRYPAHQSYSLTQHTSDDKGTFTRTASLSPRHKVVGGACHGGITAVNSVDSAYSSEQGSQMMQPHPLPVGVPIEDAPVDWESLGSLGQHRQRAVHNLISAELTFYDELKTGIDTYINPLRTILPPDVHQRMFLGLPQLSAISMVISSQLKARRVRYTTDPPPVSSYIESLSDIYWAKLTELLECLKVCLQNSSLARQEIAHSFTNYENFSRLVEDSVVRDKKASIYSFVEAVNDYLPKLTRSMFALVYFTPLYHDDHRHLSSITEALVSICKDKELLQRWEREHEAMKRLQLCVGFGSKVHQFRLMTPGRLLIYEGEMTLVERRRKRKVWVLLLSDLLLITRRQGKILTVMEDPVQLEHLMVTDIHCTDPTEIQLSTVDGSVTRLVRAVGVKEKEEWLTKIKDRASGSLSNRRKQGDKPRSCIQPHIQDALRKQSQQFQATAVANEQSNAVLSSVSPLSQEATDGKQEDMKRGVGKRRSLFNVGSRRDKKDKLSPERDSGLKAKKGFRGGRTVVAKKKLSLADVSVDTLKQWETSFNSLIRSDDGLELFEEFLKSEFSEENIQFWKACERFKTVPQETLANEATAIYGEYILQHAAKWVNIDHQTSKEICEKMKTPDKSVFLKAQHQIYLLMARDSFVRFVKSEPFQSALKR